MLDHNYIAGLVDSDGCLSIVKRNRKECKPTYSARFQLHWKWSEKAEEICKELQNMYGGNIGEVVRPPRATLITYSLTDKRMDKFLSEVGPCVILKQEEIKVLKELRLCMKEKKPGEAKSDELLNRQESLKQKLQELHKEAIYAGSSDT